jgi:hypothetical protein
LRQGKTPLDNGLVYFPLKSKARARECAKKLNIKKTVKAEKEKIIAPEV